MHGCNGTTFSELLFLEAEDAEKDISLYINSPGGEITSGMAIFDTMNSIKPDVSTICVGMAASMGAFLLANGAKGKRYALPNSEIMIHQPLGGARGQASAYHEIPWRTAVCQIQCAGMEAPEPLCECRSHV